MTRYYVETGRGCGIIEATSPDEARKEALLEVGHYDGVSVVREATKADIEWVTAMGGKVPELLRQKKCSLCGEMMVELESVGYAHICPKTRTKLQEEHQLATEALWEVTMGLGGLADEWEAYKSKGDVYDTGVEDGKKSCARSLRKLIAEDGLKDDTKEELERLKALLNTPVLYDFSGGVILEAAHQRERWGSKHDAGKTPADWFWLVGYLAGKALHAQMTGNSKKALHHTISTAAALANWHAAILGIHTEMRPGIDPTDFGIKSGEDSDDDSRPG